MRPVSLVCLPLAACVLFAQPPANPVVEPRGVINAFTQTPAPSTVGPGGIIWITGLNLASADAKAPPGGPLPTQLSGVEVRIDGVAAPLFSVSSSKIVTQVPWETRPGAARVVVVSANGSSKPAHMIVRAFSPSIRTVSDAGFGAAAGKQSGSTLTISANGLGPTTPAAANGQSGAADGSITAPVAVFVGGMPAAATATLASDRIGEFDVATTVPPTAQAGDLIQVIAGSLGNLTTFQSLKSPVVQYLLVPDGSPAITDLVTADLKGNYVAANGARDATGCYPSVLFDFGNKVATPISNCLTAANRNAATPFVTATDNNALAALAGPPVGELPAGVSAQVMLFNPANSGPISAQLASAAVSLGSTAGNFVATIPGTPPSTETIDALTADVRDNGSVRPSAVAPPPRNVDLGNGLKVILAVARLSATSFAVVVGDDADASTNAKIAFVDDQENVTSTADFPAGWLPLVTPKNPAATAAANAALARLRVTTAVTGAVVSVLARSANGPKHAFIVFPESGARIVSFPDGWYAASCTATISLSSLVLSTGIVLEAALSEDLSFKNPCPADGFLIFDPTGPSVQAVALPDQGQITAGVAGDVSDYHYATKFVARGGAPDTLSVLDGATVSAFSLALPAGVASFAGASPIPEINAVVALANNRAAGDGGIVVFDLDDALVTVLPVPDGFQTVSAIGPGGLAAGFLPATRKLAVRANKAGGAGSQYVIYDLSGRNNAGLFVVPNPDGVAFVGGLPAQAAQLQRVNARSNTIAAVGYSADRKQAGVLVVRVP